MDKNFINEGTMVDAFKKIRKGDEMVVTSPNHSFSVQIIDKYSDQIRFQYNGETFIITDNSYQNNMLSSIKVIFDNNGKQIKTTKGPTVKNVTMIEFFRNGQSVDKVMGQGAPSSNTQQVPGSTSGQTQQNQTQPQQNTTQSGSTQNQSIPNAQQREDDLKAQLSSFNENDIIEITTGKLITTGKDKGKVAKNSMTLLKFVVKKEIKGYLRLIPFTFEGVDQAKYQSSIDLNSYFYIGDNSFEITQDLFNIKFKVKNLNTGKMSLMKIDNVVSMEDGGLFKLPPNLTLDDMKKDPTFSKMMLKSPTFLGRLLGLGSTGLTAIGQDLAKYGLGKESNKEVTIRYQYIGPNLRSGYRLSLLNGKVYRGRYKNGKYIKTMDTNNKDYMEVHLKTNLGDNKYEVEVYMSTYINSQQKRTYLGTGEIKIIEKL